MEKNLELKNRIKEVRKEKNFSQTQLAKMVGVSRNTICSLETYKFSPTSLLALRICIALEKKFEDVFYLQ